MSRATLKWLETHGTGPYRHEVIADICDRLDEGEEMGVDYLIQGPVAQSGSRYESKPHPFGQLYSSALNCLTLYFPRLLHARLLRAPPCQSNHAALFARVTSHGFVVVLRQDP